MYCPCYAGDGTSAGPGCPIAHRDCTSILLPATGCLLPILLPTLCHRSLILYHEISSRRHRMGQLSTIYKMDNTFPFRLWLLSTYSIHQDTPQTRCPFISLLTGLYTHLTASWGKALPFLRICLPICRA